ncbi:MAG: hypothetical protein NC251_02220 [Lachnoclostridium sp.]|nr:hypothetical protein [Lachnoclostridium sp.]
MELILAVIGLAIAVIAFFLPYNEDIIYHVDMREKVFVIHKKCNQRNKESYAS